MASVLLLLLLPCQLSALLSCFHCTSNQTNEQCTTRCRGEFCAVWRWQPSEGTRHVQQGCISALPNTKIGCRKNQVGATLCICNDSDDCNTEHRSESTVPVLPFVRLPFVHCRSVVHLPLEAARPPALPPRGPQSTAEEEEEDVPLRIGTDRTSCHSNYCLFTKTETVAEEGQRRPPPAPSDFAVSLCPPHPEHEFDVRLWEGDDLLRGLEPNFCYRIRRQKNRAETTCICSTNECNSSPFLGGDGPIQCYMVEGKAREEDVDTYSLCHGDFCFIRQSESGLFSKGCLSVRQMGLHHTSLQPGNRSVFGEQQWLCHSQLCNLNLARLEKTNHPRVGHGIITAAAASLFSSLFLVLSIRLAVLC